MLKKTPNLEEALEKYLLLLHEEKYFDAHEILEEAWHPLRKNQHPLRNLVKGLINGAICFEHIKRDKKNAYEKASKVIKSFERHKYLSQEGIEYFELFEESCKRIENLKKRHKIV